MKSISTVHDAIQYMISVYYTVYDIIYYQLQFDLII